MTANLWVKCRRPAASARAFFLDPLRELHLDCGRYGRRILKSKRLAVKGKMFFLGGERYGNAEDS